MKKDLLKITDLSCEDITHILDVADQLKYNQKHGIPHRLLEGKTLAMIFQKSSTRTRVSFDVGMFQLGGHAMFYLPLIFRWAEASLSVTPPVFFPVIVTVL